MKAFLILGALALLFVVLSLSGVLPGGPGGHGPGRHTGGDDPSPGSHGINGVGGPAPSSEATRTVEVTTLDTMTFEPGTISVSTGEAITFVVANNGDVAHEFTLGDASMQEEHAEAMDHMPAGMAHDNPNSITVQPGETEQLTWRFGDATVEYACHQDDHHRAGMRGEVSIA